jgi:hypothetical protein
MGFEGIGMNKLIEIAKANGAERIEAHDEFTQSGVFFQDDQLCATVEQVCAPLVEALKRGRTGLHKAVEGDDPCSCSECDFVRLRISALAAYRTLIGDKE